MFSSVRVYLVTGHAISKEPIQIHRDIGGKIVISLNKKKLNKRTI